MKEKEQAGEENPSSVCPQMHTNTFAACMMKSCVRFLSALPLPIP